MVSRQDKYKIGGLIFLIALSIVAHWQWVFLPGIFTSGDWGYIQNQAFTEFLTTPKILTGSSNFTIGSVTPMFDIIVTAGSILGKIVSMDFALFERIFVFWPITLLGPIPIYILLYRKFRSTLGATAGSMLYCFNTYIIAREMTHVYIPIAFLLAPLLVITTENLLYKPSKKSAFFFIATTAIFSVYEIRILYILSILMAAYGVYLLATKKIQSSKKLWVAIASSIGILTFMQAYWLSPFLFNKSSLGYVAITGRGLFRSYTQISHALTLSDTFWLATEPWKAMAPQWWLYAVPIVAMLWIVTKEGRKKTNSAWFWFGVVLLSIFLLKQSNPPFPYAYEWLYEKIPGFRLFRESSKFMVLPAIAYAILIAHSIALLKKRSTSAALIAAIFISGIFFFHTRPLITGSIEALTMPTSFPEAYANIENFLESDPTFNRSLWIPSIQRFTFSSETHPSVNANGIVYAEWAPFLENTNNPLSLLTQKNIKSLLNFGSIKYVTAPLDTNNDIYRWFGKPQEDFNNIIAAIPGLKKVDLASNEISIWGNSEAKPHAYIANNVELSDSPIFFSGLDQQQKTASLFTSENSKETLEKLYETVITNEEITPFSPRNIIVKNGVIETRSMIASNSPLTTYIATEPSSALVSLFSRAEEDHITLYIELNNEKKPIAEFERSGNSFWIQLNKKDFFFTADDVKEKFLGIARIQSTDNEIAIFGEIDTHKKLISNASFEDGIWDTVGDCNNSDKSSLAANQISSSQFPLATDGQYSLQLSAGNHLGCIAAPIEPVENVDKYRITFDYKLLRGNAGSFKIVQDGTPTVVVVSQEMDNTSSWQHRSATYENTDEAPVSLYLYQGGEEENSEPASSLFDNFSVLAYRAIDKRMFEGTASDDRFVTKPFSPSDIRIEDRNITGNNLIEDGFFEENIEHIAGDCNNQDGTPPESNGIKATIVTSDNGTNALSLEARRHIACTNLAVSPIDPAYDYLLSIRYKTILGNPPSFTFYPRVPEETQAIQLPKNRNESWETFTTIIAGKDISPDASLILYVSASEKSSKATFDDIQLMQIPILPKLYVRTAEKPLTDATSSLKSINPTLHFLASNPIEEPRLLVLSDKFDPSWKLFVRPQGTSHPSWWKRIIGTPPGIEISKDTHIVANAFVNGWVLNPAEIANAIGKDIPPEFVIEYWPQRLMDLGSTISIATIALFLIYSLVGLLKKILAPKQPPSYISSP